MFPFLPFHVIDKHNPQSYNRNYIVLLDCSRNMYMVMSKLIREFNFKVFWCPMPESHGNVFQTFLGSFEDIQGKVWNWLEQYIPGEMFCMTILEETVITLRWDMQAHSNSHLTIGPGTQAGPEVLGHPSGMWPSGGCLSLATRWRKRLQRLYAHGNSTIDLL